MTQSSYAKLAAERKPFAGESGEYTQSRQKLLAEEIELQTRIDAVAEQRRALPLGPIIKKNYKFVDTNGDAVGLANLFGGHSTLITYFWMYGPDRQRPCPMCTNLLGPLDANAKDLMQRVSLAVLGRSTVKRQLAFAKERRWHNLKFYQTDDAYPLDFGGLNPENGEEYPVMAVFERIWTGDDTEIRLFWRGEMTKQMAPDGKDPRGGPDFAPLWTALDLTREGRGQKWYPKLEY